MKNIYLILVILICIISTFATTPAFALSEFVVSAPQTLNAEDRTSLLSALNTNTPIHAIREGARWRVIIGKAGSREQQQTMSQFLTQLASTQNKDRELAAAIQSYALHYSYGTGEAAILLRLAIANQIGISPTLLENYPDLQQFIIANKIEKQLSTYGDSITVAKYGIPVLTINGKRATWNKLKGSLPIDPTTGKLKGMVYGKDGFVIRPSKPPEPSTPSPETPEPSKPPTAPPSETPKPSTPSPETPEPSKPPTAPPSETPEPSTPSPETPKPSTPHTTPPSETPKPSTPPVLETPKPPTQQEPPSPTSTPPPSQIPPKLELPQTVPPTQQEPSSQPPPQQEPVPPKPDPTTPTEPNDTEQADLKILGTVGGECSSFIQCKDLAIPSLTPEHLYVHLQGTRPITLVSAFDDFIKDYAILSIPHQKEYAQKHGYSYYAYKGNLTETAEPAGSSNATREAYWSKIVAINGLLKNVPDGAWLIWIDADVLFTNSLKTWEGLIEKYGHYDGIQRDVIVTKDAEWNQSNPIPINNAVIMIRNGPWARKYFQRVWDQDQWARKGQGDCIHGCHYEQQSMTWLWDKLGLESNRMLRIDQREMNSFYRYWHKNRDAVWVLYKDPVESMWRHGDFIAQVTGMPEDLRLKIIQYILANCIDKVCARYEPNNMGSDSDDLIERHKLSLANEQARNLDKELNDNYPTEAASIPKIDARSIVYQYTDPSPSQLTIVSASDRDSQDLANISFEKLKEYAQKHHDSLVIYRDLISTSESTENPDSRNSSWAYIIALANTLSTVPEESWVAWVAPNVLFTNTNKSLRHIIRDYEKLNGIQRHIFMNLSSSYDLWPNSDIIMVRNTPQARKILQKVWEMYLNSKYLSYFSDAALTILSQLSPTILPISLVQEYPRQWKPGDFAAASLYPSDMQYLVDYCIDQNCKPKPDE